jgi:YbbR domain-containing protein
MIRENFWIKAASVLLAIGLWMFVISKGRSEISLPVKLEVENIPEGLVLTEYPQEDIILSISGHERFLRRISPEEIRVTVDLTGYKAGKHRYNIGRSDVNVPSPLRVVNISPSSIDIMLAEAQSRKVPVRAVIAGRPADGYVVNSIEVVPGEIEVLGAKATIRKLSFVETGPVDVSGKTETFEVNAPIEAGHKPFSPRTSSVTVRVVIEKEHK